MKLFIKILLLFILVILTAASNAQRIKATASIDSTNILLGDQVKLFLEIELPKNIRIEFPTVPDTIAGNVEVLTRYKTDTVKNENEEFQKQIRTYLITSFDSGSYRIPPFWFKIELDGRYDSIPTNGVTLNVHTIPIDTTRGPTDIKMPYDAPLTLKEVIPYILGTILLGAILFLIFYAIKRKKSNQPLFALLKRPKEPAHIIALRELDRIKKEKIWQQGKIKQFHSEVTETLRKYIEDRFGIPAMEQTSDETIGSFRNNRELLKNKTFENLIQILKLADLVKFAKYQPLPDDNNMTLVNTYFFVSDTKIEEIKTETPEAIQEEEGEDVEIK